MDNKFVFVIGSRNNEEWVESNLNSIFCQDYRNFRVIYFTDASEDDTLKKAIAYNSIHSNMQLLEATEREYKTWFFSILDEKYKIQDDEILVFVDGDDFLASDGVLSYLNSIYNQTNCWMTYGGMGVWDGDDVTEPFPQNSEIPPAIFEEKAFRKDMWRTSHLKTMRGFLWKKFNKEDLKPEGVFGPCQDDLAIMFAMLEMCPSDKVFRVKEQLYIYNNHSNNGTNVGSRGCAELKNKSNLETIIRNIPPYETISFVTPTLAGGLGNQMFEIAAAASLAKDNGAILLLNTSEHILPNQGRNINNYTSNVFSGIALTNSIKHDHEHKREICTYEPIPYQRNLKINGHFQSYKYFDHNREYIQKLFTAPDNIMKSIIGEEWDFPDYRRKTGLQIRRGDYCKFPDHHPLLPVEYFHDTIERIDPDGIIWIFTDDKKWCEENFKPNYRLVKYIQEEDYIELYMMSFCKNLIISNSSFGWWAAYLNTREDKEIYVPSTWFGRALIAEGFKMEDLILPQWNVVNV